MNIWWINQHAGAPDDAGHTRHYSLAYYLTKQGHKVTLVTSDFNYFSLKKRVTQSIGRFTHEEINRVDYLWVREVPYRPNYFYRLLSMFAFAHMCKELVHVPQLTKPDIIIGSSPPLFAADAARKLAKKLNVPFVLEVRDIWPMAIMSLKKVSAWHPLMLYMKMIEKRLYKHAAGIISIMPKFSTYLKDEGIVAGNIKYIPHGIDYELFSGAADMVQKDKLTIIHAGKFAVANHLSVVLEAAKILQANHPDLPIEFWLIGEGVEKQTLLKQAQQYHLKRVKFFDPLPKNQIYAFLQQADAFLLHVKCADVYRYGATTNRLSDYLASGRPLIYAFSSNSYDPVTLSQCGLSIPSEDPKALAEAAIALYQLPFHDRVQMGERAMSYAKMHHNLAVLAEELSDFLQQCV